MNYLLGMANLFRLIYTKYTTFYPAQSLDWSGSVCCISVCLSVSVCVCNHFSPHPPPYIELSFSSSLCWYIYSPETTQI